MAKSGAIDSVVMRLHMSENKKYGCLLVDTETPNTLAMFDYIEKFADWFVKLDIEYGNISESEKEKRKQDIIQEINIDGYCCPFWYEAIKVPINPEGELASEFEKILEDHNINC